MNCDVADFDRRCWRGNKESAPLWNEMELKSPFDRRVISYVAPVGMSIKFKIRLKGQKPQREQNDVN